MNNNNGHVQKKAWGNLLPEFAPGRSNTKPRREGITMILDRCQGHIATQDLLELGGDYVDHINQWCGY